jgi:tetratricopeptide (TPR) repeat protein
VEAQRCGDRPTLGKANYVLARSRGFLLCHFDEGVAHAEAAVAALEGTREWVWLGQSYWVVGMNCALSGEFERGLQAAAKGFALGEQSGDPRAQTYNAWVRGWLLATRGDWEPAIAACELSASLAPDVFSGVASTGWLGRAYLEKGDCERAIPLLEQTYRDLVRYGYRGIQGWFTAWLGEAYLANGDIARACEIAREGISTAESIPNPWAVAANSRVLGGAALMTADLTAARDLLEGALRTFTSLGSRFDAGKTHLLLARLAERRGEERLAIDHLTTARQLFEAVEAPAYVERAAQAVQRLGGG